MGKLVFNYVDGLCGSGKTYGLGKYIKSDNRHNKIIIATPSKVLAGEIHKDLMDMGIQDLYLIHSETIEKKVVREIMDCIEKVNMYDEGVIICTQQALHLIPFIERKNEWMLIVDEIPKIDKFYDPVLPYGNVILLDYMQLGETLGTNLYELKRKDGTSSDLNYDSMIEVIMPIFNIVKDDNQKLFTIKKQWDKLVLEKRITDDSKVDMTYGNQLNKIYFMSLLQPGIYSGFKNTVIMGANFEYSMLYKYWSEFCNVDFKPFDLIKNKLRYTKYQNGERLKIIYLQEDDWSKYSSRKSITGMSRLEYYQKKVEDYFGDKEFIYMKNNGDDTFFVNGKHVPVVSHGLNTFDHIDNIYFSPALNNVPQHNQMLEDLGFNKDFIKRANAHESLHQGVMRTSLRNPDATSLVTAIVPDKSSAESLARLFIGCTLGPIDGCLSKVKALSQSDKNRNYRMDKIVKDHDLNSLVRMQTGATEEYTNAIMSTNIYNIIENSTQNNTSFTNHEIGFTLLSDLYNKTTTSHKSTPLEFIALMKKIWTNHVISNKNGINLYNGVTYKTDQSRCLNNVDYASICVVDIDNGDLSPDDFYDIFNKKHKHSFLLCNSYSRSKEKPNCFRAIFFIDQKVNDEIYRLTHDYIKRVIKDYGYISATKEEQKKLLERNPNAKFSGIDLTKTHTASFFYLPCKVIGREDWSFFLKGNCRNLKEIERYAIKIDNVIQYSPEQFELPELVYENESKKSGYDSIDLNDVKEFIMKSTNLKHLGSHDKYGRMAAGMKSAGFSLYDFKEVTPFISDSKTARDAEKYWNSWGSNNQGKKITMGTVLHLIEYSKSP